MSALEAFYATLQRCLEAGETTAVATIVETRGSSPREVGAKMLVRPSGDIDGTVGGGCGEADVWRTALDVMADGEARMVTVDLTQEIAMNTDGVCGGIMDIFVQPWASPLDLSQALVQAIEAKRAAVLATVVGGTGPARCQPGARLLVVDGALKAADLGWGPLQERVLADIPSVLAAHRSGVRTYELPPDDQDGRSTSSSVSVFFELVLPQPVLVIIGAGHIAVPMAQVGKLLDFEVVVIDDRPSFANAARFPTANRIIVDDFETALDQLPITPSTYVVLVTRGHAHDVRSLRKIIDKPAAYIGMIGSRRRVFAVFKLLHEEGVPVESVLRVRAPIGLDIKTETPGEIAISVGAEMVRVRRGGGAASFSELLRDQYRASLTRGEKRPATASPRSVTDR